jgi:hypothetical protein
VGYARVSTEQQDLTASATGTDAHPPTIRRSNERGEYEPGSPRSVGPNTNASWDSGGAMPGRLAGRSAGAGRHGRVGRAVKDLGRAQGDLNVPQYRRAHCDRAPRWIEDGEAARVVAVGIFHESSRE